MLWLDPKFHDHIGRYVAQCALATLTLLFVLLVLDAEQNVAVIAALGASSFIVFTMPHATRSRPRYLVGGYIVGIVSGLLCHLLFVGLSHLPVPQGSLHLVCAALSVGFAIFAMVTLDLEHPPAAGVALGLILNDCSVKTILVTVAGIVALSLLKTILKPVLMDLL